MKILIFAFLIAFSSIYSQVDTIPPATPRNVQAFGYEKHIDLVWWDNEEPDLAGYKVYRKMNNQWYYWTTVSKEKSYLILSNLPLNYSLTLKVSAIDQSGNESPLSDSVVATTHIMSDEEFLDMVQRATFRYFWDLAHPNCGLARERNNSGDVVTIGGSGFGVMALIVGIERNFISRVSGAKRLLKILNFLTNTAQRFHGAFPHWLNGWTGQVIPFSQYDDGGDLVETSFLLQGLLAARQYFNRNDSLEIEIRNKINHIWQTVEFSWYRRSPYSTYLYWHWSPNYGWAMNFKLMGWNETMICYLLGIASPTYSIPASTYYQGWASSPSYFNERITYGYKLFVGQNLGGPLFFTHYSFLGFDPRNKKDNYCNYFIHNRNQTLVNRAYCINNPKRFAGYDSLNWGITASDNPWGYSAHEPLVNDNGTLAPTAALSSMPYTPNESIATLKHFYRNYYSQLWGTYGFKDAFNLSQNWFANSYLAIDQGPIIVMIENYRTGLLWNLFMSNPEIQNALNMIGFVPDSTQTSVEENEIINNQFSTLRNYPNPFNNETEIEFEINFASNVKISIYDLIGREVEVISNEFYNPGKHRIKWQPKSNLSSSIYFIVANTPKNKLLHKIILLR
ncbi:MAG: T9SS type A sorting domain-containing protein [Ignavibacteria bacterium]|nr:T9SS type A sorting domain-containing protein [Ignavibacteria bacterium]